MTTFRIEMMTKGDFHEYMTGGYNYRVCKVDIEADTAEQAMAIARQENPDMIININHIRTVIELEELASKRKAEFDAFLKAEEERKANAKARKEEKEKAKAKALGLTVEEYKAKVKHDKKVRDAEARIAALKAELAKEEKYLEKLKKEA